MNHHRSRQLGKRRRDAGPHSGRRSTNRPRPGSAPGTPGRGRGVDVLLLVGSEVSACRPRCRMVSRRGDLPAGPAMMKPHHRPSTPADDPQQTPALVGPDLADAYSFCHPHSLPTPHCPDLHPNGASCHHTSIGARVTMRWGHAGRLRHAARTALHRPASPSSMAHAPGT